MAQSHMVTRAAQYGHDYYYAIARGYDPVTQANGAVPGAYPFGGFGERVTAGAVVNGPLWPNGALYIPAITGVQPSISSLSANDTLAGTGVQIVEVHYLDANLDPQAELVSMNGVTPVPMVATDVRWIQCLHAYQVGSGGGAASTISALFGANTLSQIATSDVRCRSSFRMVPRGKVCFVSGMAAGAVSGTAAAQVHIEVVATELDTHQFTQQGIFMPFGEVALQDSSESLTLLVPLKFREGTIIGMMFTTDKAALVTGTFFGWVEDV